MEIPQICPSQTTLFDTLGFRDTNYNGVIEKNKPNATPRQDEGYKKDADLNGDGKIIEAEAKYYLRNLNNVSTIIKQEFPVTMADWQTLFKAADKISNPRLKEVARKEIIKIMAKDGLYEEAVKTLSKMDWTIFKEDAIKGIAKEIIKFGLFEDSPKIARKIDDSKGKLVFIIEIASEISRTDWGAPSGLDPATAIQIINKLLKIVHPLQISAFKKSEALHYLALGMAKYRLFKKAIMTARKIKVLTWKASTLGDIASVMAYLISDKNKVKQVFIEARTVARTVNDRTWKDWKFRSIAREMTRADLIKDALETAEMIDRHNCKSAAFSEIASKIKKINSFKKALKLAKTIKDAICKYTFIEKVKSGLATKLAELGSFEEALKVARTINSSYSKALIISDIAMIKADSDKTKAAEIFKEALINTYSINGSSWRKDAISKIEDKIFNAGLTMNQIMYGDK
jgi:tetratricopeptide (TPR) repeat protein